MKITIIGAGSMGGAIALGLVASGAVSAADLTVTAAHAGTLSKFSAKGIQTSLDNVAAVRGADVVFLAVKPWVMPAVVAQIAPALASEAAAPAVQAAADSAAPATHNAPAQTSAAAAPLVVSVAPGVKSADLLAMFANSAPRLAYVIPNTAIELLQSMTFIAGVTATAADIELLQTLFSKCGSCMVVPEDRLMAGTALASCGIAYALRYIRAASEGGVEMGFYAKDAHRIVAQTVMGAASLLLEHGSHPEEEIDKVTTPGGLTIKGLNAMEAAGFTDAVVKGLKAGRN